MRILLIIFLGICGLTFAGCSTTSNHASYYPPKTSHSSVTQNAPTSYNQESQMGPDGVFREPSGEVDKSASCEYHGWSSYQCKRAFALDAAQSGQSAQEWAKYKTDNLKRWLSYCRPRGICWDDAKRRAGNWWRNP